MTENENGLLVEVEVFRLLGSSRPEETHLFLSWDKNEDFHPRITVSPTLQEIRSFEVLYGTLAQFLRSDDDPKGTEEFQTLEQCLLISTPQKYASVWQLYNKEDEYIWARAYVVLRLKEKLMFSRT